MLSVPFIAVEEVGAGSHRQCVPGPAHIDRVHPRITLSSQDPDWAPLIEPNCHRAEAEDAVDPHQPQRSAFWRNRRHRSDHPTPLASMDSVTLGLGMPAIRPTSDLVGGRCKTSPSRPLLGSGQSWSCRQLSTQGQRRFCILATRPASGTLVCRVRNSLISCRMGHATNGTPEGRPDHDRGGTRAIAGVVAAVEVGAVAGFAVQDHLEVCRRFGQPERGGPTGVLDRDGGQVAAPVRGETVGRIDR